MTNDHQQPREENAVGVSSPGISVPDASHPRFQKPYRCTESSHSGFVLKKLHEHFSKDKHNCVSLCQRCGSNQVFEFFNIIEGRQNMKFYCYECKARTVIDPVKEGERGDPISQSQNSIFDSSETESELYSSVSVTSEQSDVQNTSYDISSPSLSESTSVQNGSSNGSLND